VCINKPGEFVCGCHPGFSLLGDGKTCEDINECLGNHGCRSTAHGQLAGGATCKNLQGSYECECQAPLVHVDNVTCDIDECAAPVGVLPGAPAGAPAAAPAGASALISLGYHQEPPNGGCSHSCQNLPGGFICTCPAGYLLDENPELENPGKSCKDIDECTDRPDLVKCKGEGSICKNTPGSFTCECAEGWTQNGDGVSCTFKPATEVAASGTVVTPPPAPVIVVPDARAPGAAPAR
jgi:fibulin 1/2